MLPQGILKGEAALDIVAHTVDDLFEPPVLDLIGDNIQTLGERDSGVDDRGHLPGEDRQLHDRRGLHLELLHQRADSPFGTDPLNDDLIPVQQPLGFFQGGGDLFPLHGLTEFVFPHIDEGCHGFSSLHTFPEVW